MFWLYHGDCVATMQSWPENTIDAIVCDPPYSIGFMGKTWDQQGVASDPTTWAQALRVLKPGGHLLAFGGTRTWHRLACAIEDAGFELRDSLMWLYGTGFPKSLDVSKALDAAAGAERAVVGFDASRVRVNRKYRAGAIGNIGGSNKVSDRTDNGATLTAPATDLAKRWEGWGTALKPSFEPICLARKPLEGTVAANVAKWGTGALNIGGCRIHSGPSVGGSISGGSALGQSSGWNAHENRTTGIDRSMAQGRWPANVVLDEEAGTLLDAQAGSRKSGARKTTSRRSAEGERGVYGQYAGDGTQAYPIDVPASEGGPSRFFYCAKATRAERDSGGVENRHPTVKPINLMRYLIRLVTPPGGVVLDPFCGSGSTGAAAILEGFKFVGIEQEVEYLTIAHARVTAALSAKGIE